MKNRLKINILLLLFMFIFVTISYCQKSNKFNFKKEFRFELGYDSSKLLKAIKSGKYDVISDTKENDTLRYIDIKVKTDLIGCDVQGMTLWLTRDTLVSVTIYAIPDKKTMASLFDLAKKSNLSGPNENATDEEKTMFRYNMFAVYDNIEFIMNIADIGADHLTRININKRQ